VSYGPSPRTPHDIGHAPGSRRVKPEIAERRQGNGRSRGKRSAAVKQCAADKIAALKGDGVEARTVVGGYSAVKSPAENVMSCVSVFGIHTDADFESVPERSDSSLPPGQR
jgi:hypothetical protein